MALGKRGVGRDTGRQGLGQRRKAGWGRGRQAGGTTSVDESEQPQTMDTI